MSHFSHSIVFVIEPTQMDTVFDNFHEVLTENNFEFEEEPFNEIWLEDIDTDDREDYLFEAQTIEPKSINERDQAVERLKKHRTGGTINYRGVKDKFEGLPPYDVLLGFSSLDNATIEYIVISARDYIFDPHADVFESIIKSVLNKITIIGIAKGIDYPDEWGEEEVAELIKLKKLAQVHPRLVYNHTANNKNN